MIHFILASHSELAHGMKETIKMLTGIDEPISAYGLKENVNVIEISEAIREKIKNSSDGDIFVIVTDIPGGSVNNALLDLVNSEKVYLLSGMNVALLLNLVLKPKINEKEIAECIELATQSIVFFGKDIFEKNTEGDDFFD
ncbi:PTS sugar transporter subunit IIA [Vagococcus elongatus]|uniref:PTS EIIA type-4 domain-containing protein n=1 Tax=Vagococcus elongatus TaxID=180344 RepID=A0A430AT82_9ENTE|nr:hypothetical protein [Vagococcus elongatus]RSU11257.1 hypothetical protein CBF29_08085 [Vagococcus elongatus]